MAVEGRGVLYLGHLPAGFEENELKDYFKQFGAVTRVKLSRSTRSGGSKGYAFVEFASEEVAAIAAESMDGYLMFNKVLKCKVVPPEKIHPSLFKGCNRPFRPSAHWKNTVKEVNKDREQKGALKGTRRLHLRVKTQLKKLKALGLNPPDPFVNKDAVTPSEPAAVDVKPEVKKTKTGKEKN